MSIYKGTELLAGVATNTIYNAHDLFDNKWTDHLLNDQSWLRADTFSWQDGTVYTEAYNHLVADYNGGTSQTETVGSYTITYVLATDGHKITIDETNIANIYNESGVAWYYILDTTNHRFKLPRENPAREELIQVIRAKGNGKTLGLTNGTDNFGLVSGVYNSSGTYALGQSTSSYGQNTGGNGTTQASSDKWSGITTDSTNSGIISSMTDSTSVYKGKQYLYFYVGQFSQSATEQTAGLNSELFNGKADVDLSNAAPNASASAKSIIVGWGMPDLNNGVYYNNSAPTEFTAPYDCYCEVKGSTLSYDLYKPDETTLIASEYAYSASYTSAHILLRKGYVLKRTSVSSYNLFAYWPFVGGEN